MKNIKYLLVIACVAVVMVTMVVCTGIERERTVPTDNISDTEAETICEIEVPKSEETTTKDTVEETEQIEITETNDIIISTTQLNEITEKELSYKKPYTESDIIMCAKVLYGECENVKDKANQAAVIWTILNRVDSGFGSIEEVITSPNQFAYNKHFPVKDNLYELSVDVLERWTREQNGEADVGRVLPFEFKWYSGNGVINKFRDACYYPFEYWDFSMPNPYE